MAEKYTQKKKTVKKAPTKKAAAEEKKRMAEQQKIEAEKRAERRALWAQIVPYFFIVGAILLLICLFTGKGEDPGIITGFIYKSLTGLLAFQPLLSPHSLCLRAFASFLTKTTA